jgi:multiple sugar transport system substrate-binding protein
MARTQLQEIELADSVVAQWNALHPDIRETAVPVSQSTEEGVTAAIAGKTTPDVCSNIWPGALHEYTQSGGLIPLDTFPDFREVALGRIPPELLATFKSDDGHYYQFPWKTNPVMMYYNLRMLHEAGIDSVPRTYAEYFAAGKKISRDTTGDGQVDVWMGERDVRPIWWQRLFDFYPFYIAASGGGTLFSNGEVAFDNDAGVKVLSFFQRCCANEY